MGDSFPEARAVQPARGTPGGTSSLVNWARTAKSVALLCFLLPWVTVSCAGQTLVSISGIRLAAGNLTVRNPSTGVTETHGSPELIVLVAALVIALGLLASLIRARRLGALVGLWSCAAAAALLCFEVLIRIPELFRESLAGRTPPAGSFDASLAASTQQLINVNTAPGFWLMICALAAAIGLNWAIQKRAREATREGPSRPA